MKKKGNQFLLKLYITGASPQSKRALINIKRICEKYLKDNYKLEVVDIYQRPEVAHNEQLIATPTLIKIFPKPLRRLVGDLSNESKVLFGMDLLDKAK